MSTWAQNMTWGVVNHVDATTQYSLTITGFNIDFMYQFRVDVVRMDGDKISKDVATGYSTDPLKLSCPRM